MPGIVEAENFDSDGFSDATPGNEGGAYRDDVDVDIKDVASGYAVGWMTAGEWLEYTVQVEQEAEYTVTLRAGAVDAGRQLRLSNCEGNLSAPITISQVASWGQMATINAGKVHLEPGLQVIRLTVGPSDYIDLDSLRFELADENPLSKANFFVAPDGDDNSPGTLEDPFKTLAKARDAVRAINSDMTDDIHVFLRGGTYRQTGPVQFTPRDSGTNGYRVFYRAYPGETPVISGAVPVTGWTRHDDRLFKAVLDRSTKLRNLYVNETRAAMTSKRISSQGGNGTYTVNSGQASWAWASGSASDSIKYRAGDLPEISRNRDDLEVVNGTLWNENIVTSRDVTLASDGSRLLLLQQPYGAIAQRPGWDSGFKVTGTHTVFNAFELFSQPGQFYFDKSSKTLYYYPRAGESMSTASVEAPVAETLISIAGTSKNDRVANLTFSGITFANTDYNLHQVANSRGKASVQAATLYIAFGDGNWHNSTYQIVDTLPGMIMLNSATNIEILDSTIKHSGNEGLALINDVTDILVEGNVITDIAGSGITVGHPQHVYIADGGARAKYSAAVEGAPQNIRIRNNLLYDISSLPGFGGHSGITAFFTDGLSIENNHIEKTAYNGISLGWGWRNFKDSTIARANTINANRLINTLTRLHDSGAIYTLGQMPGTNINKNYVRGIPPATSGPTYGLHNDEGSAYITENDNVLDIDPGVKYTINSEDFGEKHDLTILRTYATVNKMGITPPSSRIDPPVAVPDNVWPMAQYQICLDSGVNRTFEHIIPLSLMPLADRILPASAAVRSSDSSINIRSSSAEHTLWLAPAGTNQFAAGATMTRAAGNTAAIALPTRAGTYKLHVLDNQGRKLGESKAVVRVQ